VPAGSAVGACLVWYGMRVGFFQEQPGHHDHVGVWEVAVVPSSAAVCATTRGCDFARWRGQGPEAEPHWRPRRARQRAPGHWDWDVSAGSGLSRRWRLCRSRRGRALAAQSHILAFMRQGTLPGVDDTEVYEFLTRQGDPPAA